MDAANRTHFASSRNVLLAALATAAGLASGGAAGQLRPTVRTPVLGQPSGPSPSLSAPAAGAEIASSPTRPTSVLFSWTLPMNDPPPQRYMLCVAEAGAPCVDGPRAMVVPVTASSDTAGAIQAAVRPALHDKALEWSAAACGPGFGGGLALAGATNTDCNWSSRRSISVGYRPPLINLGAPGDRAAAARTSASQRFTWQEPTGVAVQSYRFCLVPQSNPNAADVTSCNQASLPAGDGSIVSVAPGRGFMDIDLRPLRQSQDRTMAWTMLSCNGGSCRLAANQPVRRFTIPGALPPPQLSKPAAGSVEPTVGDVRQPLGAFVESELKGPRTLPASVNFEWSRVGGATGYRLCISEPGVACGTGSSQVVNGRVQGFETLTWTSLAAFHGKSVNWTVASCDALGCGAWAAPRPLTIKAVPGPVTLLSPAAGASFLTHPENVPIAFSWSAPAFAEVFLIEVGSTVRGSSETTTCTTYRPRFSELRGATSWKVQACNVVGCGPVSAPRDVTFYPPLPAGGARTASSVSSGSRASSGARSSTSVLPNALPLCQ